MKTLKRIDKLIFDFWFLSKLDTKVWLTKEVDSVSAKLKPFCASKDITLKKKKNWVKS